jgi:ankyrin repeat protein/predicted DNA-binding WGR domain protein
MNLRRSARLEKTKPPAKKAKEKDVPVAYFEGQALAVTAGGKLALCIVQKDVTKKSSNFAALMLAETKTALKYAPDKEAKVSVSDVICEVDLKKEASFYRITKRLFQTVKKAYEQNHAEDGDLSELPSEEESENDESTKTKHKGKGRASEKLPKKKKAAGKPEVYKKGKFNPNIEILPSTTIFESPDNQPFFDVSVRLNNKNIHRAVITGNKQLFKNCMGSLNKISSLGDYLSPDNPITPIELAILKDDAHFITELFNEAKNSKLKMGFAPEPALQKIQTGMVGVEAFGVRVRQVQMSRGGREGNNAFLADANFYNQGPANITQDKLRNIILRGGCSKDTINLLFSMSNYLENTLAEVVGDAVRSGNLALALHLIQIFIKKGGYGFNFLHEEVLKKGKLSPFKKVSVVKKVTNNYSVAPLHAACINPNTAHLESLIAQCDDLGYADLENRRPIHYAAACTTADPLKVLLEHGANIQDVDKNKISPLMIAAMYDRVQTATLLIQKGANIHLKSKESKAAIHYAAMNNSLGVLEVLLNNGAQVDMAGTDRKTPMMFAAAMGHYECVELLMQHGGKVTKKDKCKRTPLIFAIKNGQSRLASLLLKNGADFNEADSSKNTPLHYACAYGWLECIDLLIMAGADVNANNDWKIKPLLVAMLKGQFGCVKRMLKEPNVDVNQKDDDGRTLLAQCVMMLNEEALEQLEFLITEKKADPNIPDNGGNSALHILCSSSPPQCPNYNASSEELSAWNLKAVQWQIDACNILLNGGADINMANSTGLTAVFGAIVSGNIKLMEMLMEKGADLSIVSSDGRTIFHHLSGFRVSNFEILEKLLDNEKIVSKCLNSVNDSGFNPFLYLVDNYAKNGRNLYNTLLNEQMNIERKVAVEKLEEMKAQGVDLNAAILTGADPTANVFANQSQTTGSNAASNPFGLFSLNSNQHGADPTANLFANQSQTTGLNAASNPFGLFSLNFNQKPAKLIGPPGLSGGARVAKAKRLAIYAAKYNAPSNSEDFFLNKLIDSGKATTVANQQYSEAVDHFIALLQKMISKGADCQSPVQKLLRYRSDPGLIQAEYNANLGKFGFNESAYFILDSQGNKLWKEYGDDGLKNAVHLVAKGYDDKVFEFILSLGIDLEQRDFNGNTTLITYLATDAPKNRIQAILAKGVDVNLSNYFGETALYFAVKVNGMNRIENVKLLLESGAFPDIPDKSGNTPLMIAVKEKNLNLAELLINHKADPNFPDNHKRTPLHHAFNNSDENADASFDLENLLLESGADINAVDKRGRTPLHYAFVKIGKWSEKSQIDPIETVSSACGRPGIDVNIQDEWQKTPLHYAAQRGALTSSLMLINTGANIELQDADGNTALAVSFYYNHSHYSIMLIQKGANVSTVLNVKKKPVPNQNNNMFGYNYWSYSSQPQQAELGEGTYTLFQAAVKHGWQGVAYLLLYSGYDYMLAMQDAMSEGKFKLVLTLLAKVGDDSVIQRANDKHQNLFHTFAMYGQNCPYDLMAQIGEKFMKRGVNLKAKDYKQRSPLHYAAKNHNLSLCQFLCEKTKNVNETDAKGSTPAGLAIKGDNIHTSYDILKTLINYGASFDFIILSEGVKMTPVTHAINAGASSEILSILAAAGASISEPDGRGWTPLIYAIRKNSIEFVRALCKLPGIDVNRQDIEGFSSVHHTIHSRSYGSYENVDILKELLQSGGDLTLPDYSGKTPYYYASLQKSGRFLEFLTSQGVQENLSLSRSSSIYSTQPEEEVDYESDAEKYITQHAESKIQKLLRVPDPIGEFNHNYSVVDDFDSYMVKVDVQYGPYGQFLFYRMQLLHDRNRDVYVVFTRWGRVGESGMYQRTPFSDRQEAESEYKKIYKAKTGNEWGVPFVKNNKKYRVMELQRKKINHKELLKNFDLEHTPKTGLDEELYKLMELITNAKFYIESMSKLNIEVGVLNFSCLKKETLNEAMEIIKEISLLIKRMISTHNTEDMASFKNQIYDLSSQFLELVPVTHLKGEFKLAILTEQEVNNMMNLLNSLMNIEHASKMMLGALYNQTTINPLDYTYKALRTQLKVLPSSSPEYDMIEEYIHKSSTDYEIVNMFKIHRKDEKLRFSKWDKIKERKLLWHGSGVTNFIGILTQGLKIAPPEAPSTGWMFGKGVYFADCFAKSSGYSAPMFSYDLDNSKFGNTCLILLCEVVLGKTQDLYQANYEADKLPRGYLSTKGVGQTSPDPKGSIFTPNGTEVPLGSLKPVEVPANVYTHLAYNEYIVYDTSQIRLKYLIQYKSSSP